MRQIVDQRDGIRDRQVASPRFLEGQFHLEEAAGQIDKVRLGIDLKFHGVDARREGAYGDVADAHDPQIGGRDGEQIQHGIYHPPWSPARPSRHSSSLSSSSAWSSRRRRC